MWTIPFDDITTQLKLLFLAEIFYMPSDAFTQLSFLACYLRIFPPSRYGYIAYVLGAISICFGISTSWTGEASGTCIDISAYSWYRAAMQIAMDLSIIGLPLCSLSKLSLSKRKKTLVLLMFCTGFLCLRLQSLVKFSKLPNVSMDNNPAIYWSVVECDVAIICARMPCLPSFLEPLLPGCFGTTKQYRSDENETLPAVRLDRLKKGEFSILPSSASEDALVSHHDGGFL